jgi:hypothetical protein
MSETERLSAAGARYAHGDARLEKLTPQLDQLGLRAQVFKELSSRVSALAKSTEQNCADALADLSALLYSVQHTQGKTSPDDTFAPSDANLVKFDDKQFNKLFCRQLPYSRLSQLIHALTGSGSGRIVILEAARTEGQCDDARLYPLYAAALGDRSIDVANASFSIILTIGDAMIPFVDSIYKPSSENGIVRKLTLLHKLGYDFRDGRLDKLAKSKKKDVRECAQGILDSLR